MPWKEGDFEEWTNLRIIASQIVRIRVRPDWIAEHLVIACDAGWTYRAQYCMADTESELITCPTCGHNGEEELRQLERDGYTCPQCGFGCQPNELGKKDQQARTDEEGFERATKSVEQ
jgi:DNA-directed RNA polymerase subunit RPC12/RpoP